MIENNWNFTGNPDEYFGFVYRITELSTGRMYIGKKQFKSITKVSVKGKKNKKTVIKENNWRIYTGSSTELNEAIEANGMANYKFEIVSLHHSKGALHYAEVELQVKEDVLRAKLEAGTKKYFNKQIAAVRFIPPEDIRDETRAKLSTALKGNTNGTTNKGRVAPNKGTSDSEEVRKRKSEAAKNRVRKPYKKTNPP